MAKKKTWREKVDEIEEKIHVITPEWEGRYGKGKLLIPRALDIERLINKTQRGELLTNNVIREVLAKDGACFMDVRPACEVTKARSSTSYTRRRIDP